MSPHLRCDIGCGQVFFSDTWHLFVCHWSHAIFLPSTGFLGLPAHAWVCGTNAAPPMLTGQTSFHPPCRCSQELGFPGPHATWDCPLRYFEQRGSCPGFLPSGQRDQRAWDGDEITTETKRQWKLFVSAHNGMPALVQATSARTGPPNFD
jgi:hypothetical protein